MEELLNGNNTEGPYWQINSLETITGSYQPQRFINTTLLFADECVWSANPRTANKMKGLVTEASQQCNVKFVPSKTFKSCMKIVMASNDSKVVEVTRDNRRYQMLDVTTRQFQSEQEKKAYFQTIADIPPISLAAYFLNVRLCNFDPRKVFVTERSSAALLESSPFDAWWMDVLTGNGDSDDDVDQSGTYIPGLFDDSKIGGVTVNALVESYAQYGRMAGTYRFTTTGRTPAAMTRQLRHRLAFIDPPLPKKLRRVRVSHTGKTCSIFPRLQLSQARQAFDLFVGRANDYSQ
jgi:hypothetical protein